MATVVVCDRCGGIMPDNADAALVLTTSTTRHDLCAECFGDFATFMENLPTSTRIPGEAGPA